MGDIKNVVKETINKATDTDATAAAQETVNVCSVGFGRATDSSVDFIAVLGKDDGSASIYVNTDTLQLGLAIKMLTASFIDLLEKCSEEERMNIALVMNGAEADINSDEVTIDNDKGSYIKKATESKDA